MIRKLLLLYFTFQMDGERLEELASHAGVAKAFLVTCMQERLKYQEANLSQQMQSLDPRSPAFEDRHSMSTTLNTRRRIARNSI
jgi:hypothetical protein